MSIDPNNELLQFHEFVGQCLDQGQDLTPQQALDLWRLEHPTDAEMEETLAAVHEALDEMKAGDKGVLLDDFLRELRERHDGLPQ